MAKEQKHPESVITIGTFDGVHIGHQKIINRLVSVSKKKGLKSVVLTFFPHPRMVLQPDFDLKLLHTIDERKKILSKFGLDQLVVKPFTKAFSNLSAHDYVRHILVDELNAKHIIIGYDHHFGKNRSANIEDLKIFGKEFDFQVEEISAQDIEEVSVSSTKIRTALTEGDVQTANAYLGYAYFLSGSVIKGKGLGKTINFPTANLFIEAAYKLIPKNGVYVVSAHIEGKTVYGMMNIGTNPTVETKDKPSIEVHFFKLDKDLYGQDLVVEILHRLRDEHKFESLEQLQAQLETDKLNAHNLLGIHA
ncbi:bifunctional riboflavin kinase/FAD synthetase [Subsaximicrobium wynnwilliamsii]|uniref:Riboflavin biosynthesis protein n=1 Tax=Subsaximicrobium wynnwilliamsii TaxID=291179 RepID=A0A5C6ZBD0_9FLAO|nr:bifunctional riboflavin kinase/FAD synthetase [Subsaximicrobium wynnwilliamsii]TXD81922.1 bifunctional riboflavin kinase/FAD synthetase [Subsaximicrobium wynnwilliamsii]TXD87041.1 bifunctional riboflavin kinase/FAD synthetase [Subsaximicrobium wynnwilliamsii]TXE01373.1 bifunctional riboflavin kinase/FAD synthetase [Subsaximicrobium wynnwilliamsii]